MRLARLVVAALLALSASLPFVTRAHAAACNDCGVIQSMQYVEEKGQASGVGAVAGGVIGGVLGHQIGSGRGNTAATVVGAGAGAYAGHQVEKNQKSTTSYRVGDKVKIVEGKLTRQ